MNSSLHETGDPYSDLVWPIALILFWRCLENENGDVIFLHFAENRFDVASDILTRLGVMYEVGEREERRIPHCHAFKQGWIPEQGLDLKRHEGEPSMQELIAMLCHLLEWDANRCSDLPNRVISDLSRPPPRLDMTDQDRFGGLEQYEFEEYAFRLGAAQIIKRGLGRWGPDGQGFELILADDGSSPTDPVDDYWVEHWRLKMRLGGRDFLYPPQSDVET